MNLFEVFENSRQRCPDSLCLVVNEISYSYAEMGKWVDLIASPMKNSNQPFIGVYGHRCFSAYAGILAALKAGKAYVPLNPKFPVSRNQEIIRSAAIDTLVVGANYQAGISELTANLEKLQLIYPENKNNEISNRLSNHSQICADNLTQPIGDNIAPPKDGFAYMLFTSGSTGSPKGIPITHSNVISYLDYLNERYSPSPEDKFSQTFDLTFDLSVHDMFLCWKAGSSLYCIPENILMAPAKFIRSNQLSMWFSVPSLVQVLNRFKMLKKDVFPTLRYSLFCGEPLPATLADRWQEAAPNSIVENIYGPTEATIGITHYTWKKEKQNNKTHNGIVSLGRCFSTQKYAIINEAGKQVKSGNEGELYLSGSQVSSGYWKNPKKTANQFVLSSLEEGKEKILWYKTGDIVKEDNENNLYYITRKDFQIKIRGHRIELDEINHVISGFIESDLVVSIPHPVSHGIAENIFTFICAENKKSYSEVREHCKKHLPNYMIPKNVIYLNSFPLNSNGKVDRQKLSQLL
tara:strand:+ start:179 stop:1738 length:1560 start_codon:yes stop_codon:yes gene_type:complete